MESLIELLTKLDSTVAIVVFVILLFLFCSLIGYIIKHRKDISNLLESWFKRKTKQNEVLTMIMEDHDKLEEYRKNRIEDQHQSSEIHQQLTNAIESITDKLDDIQRGFINDKIENMRWKILEFANLLINGKTCYKEQFDNILKTYDEYEEILEQNDMTNGQVEESMKFIREKYQELMNSSTR